MYIYVYIYIYIYIYIYVYGWMDGWMDGWTDGRMDGRTDKIHEIKRYNCTCLFIECINLSITWLLYHIPNEHKNKKDQQNFIKEQ